MLQAAAGRIVEGLAANQVEVWRKLASSLTGDYESKLNGLPLVELQLIIAMKLAERYGYDSNHSYDHQDEMDPEACLASYNRLMDELGLAKIGEINFETTKEL